MFLPSKFISIRECEASILKYVKCIDLEELNLVLP